MLSFPILSVRPVYPIKEGRAVDPTLRSQSEAGYVQTRPRFTRVPKSFEFSYKLIPDADKNTLKTFEESVAFTSDIFIWTHPQTSSTYNVRFDKTLEFERVAFGKWSVAVRLVEA